MKNEEKKVISSSQAPKAIGPYVQGVSWSGLVFVSGQIALSPQSMSLVEGGIKEQTLQVIQNIEAILKEEGLSFVHCLKTTCFIRDMSDFEAFNQVYESYFGRAQVARSCVAVKELPKNALVEIEVIAYKPS